MTGGHVATRQCRRSRVSIRDYPGSIPVSAGILIHRISTRRRDHVRRADVDAGHVSASKPGAQASAHIANCSR